jgi:hypothetical protein
MVIGVEQGQQAARIAITNRLAALKEFFRFSRAKLKAVAILFFKIGYFDGDEYKIYITLRLLT